MPAKGSMDVHFLETLCADLWARRLELPSLEKASGQFKHRSLPIANRHPNRSRARNRK